MSIESALDKILANTASLGRQLDARDAEIAALRTRCETAEAERDAANKAEKLTFDISARLLRERDAAVARSAAMAGALKRAQDYLKLDWEISDSAEEADRLAEIQLVVDAALSGAPNDAEPVAWQYSDLVPGQAYESKNFGAVTYVGLNEFHGEKSFMFHLGIAGYRYCRADNRKTGMSLDEFLAPKISWDAAAFSVVAHRYKIKAEYGWSDWAMARDGVEDLEEYRRARPNNIIIDPLYSRRSPSPDESENVVDGKGEAP